MSKGLFSSNQPPEKQLEMTLKEPKIKDIILDLEAGETTAFPISKKGSVTGIVCYLNRMYQGERVWHTRAKRVEFEILVIRDK